MAIIKCKMCGGDIELTADKTFGTCEFCGSTMTLPKVDDDQRAAAFNRGNHFRRIGEFDKALAVYERIVREDDTDAEAHWCCALCRFGIEYVEDPATYEYMPTCHRASFDSFLEDVDYLAAVEHSEGITKRQYQKDGAKIAEVQRGILATSQNAEPYDVFICYKESDENGDRTRDSLLAQDIYYQLTEQGRKVFFARITLEDVAGAQYEPYIFAALNSAKVMIVVGTKPEYLNAVWVKNEWSRFLAMMKKDRHKLLLPCYRDMDPYDMPEQLSVLQSYDMAKIGFIQDLTRGIAKVLDADKKPEPAKETVVVQQTAGADIAPLLKRAFMFLEDEDWESADEYCEKVLDIDPENAQAYLGKLMAEVEVSRKESLKDEGEPFDESGNYQKVLRFGDEKLKAELTGYIEYINTRNENARLEGAYQAAKVSMASADKTTNARDIPARYTAAAQAFKQLGNYQDSVALAQECRKLAENAEKDLVLTQVKLFMQYDTAYWYGRAIELLNTIPGWRDADERLAACQDGIKKDEAKTKKKRKTIAIAAIAACVVAAIVALVITVIIPAVDYSNAVALMDAGKYTEAIAAFEAMDGFMDSDAKINECKYKKACTLMDSGKYEEAFAAFLQIYGYKDSDAKTGECETAILDGKYNAAVALMEEGKYEEAMAAFDALSGYKDSRVKYGKCKTVILDREYDNAYALKEAGRYVEAIAAFEALDGHKDARRQIQALLGCLIRREPLDTGYLHTVGLKADGTVVAVGDNDYGQCNVSGWTDIVAISAGGRHTVGLKADGTVVAVGDYDDGPFEMSSWTNIIAISASARRTVGLKADGTVVAVGDNDDGQRNVSGWTNIIAISAGASHTVGLKADGTVVAVGDNHYGQCNVSGWTDIVAISAGWYHTVGLKADGTVVAVGDYDEGRCDVSGWTDIVAISAGAYHTVGLKADGTVVSTKYTGEKKYYAGQCDVSGWTDIVVISAGYHLTVGLKADGTVVAAGDND